MKTLGLVRILQYVTNAGSSASQDRGSFTHFLHCYCTSQVTLPWKSRCSAVTRTILTKVQGCLRSLCESSPYFSLLVVIRSIGTYENRRRRPSTPATPELTAETRPRPRTKKYVPASLNAQPIPSQVLGIRLDSLRFTPVPFRVRPALVDPAHIFVTVSQCPQFPLVSNDGLFVTVTLVDSARASYQ